MSAARPSENLNTALTASLVSRIWVAAIAVLSVPIYLRFMGIEAIGVVGVFTSLSALVGVLDLGMGATLTRELARLSGQPAQLPRARDTTRTLEIAYAGIALLIALLLIALSGQIARHWVQAESLTAESIGHAIALSGVALAGQWPGNLYAAGLAGLHRQAALGAMTAFVATLRVIITVLALWRDPSIEQFFLAQVVAGLLHTIGLRWLQWRALTLPGHRPRWDTSVVHAGLRFAGGMTGIALTSLLITQTDKLILSRALSLSEFGVYSLATAVTSGLYMLISPVFSVLYPRLSALAKAGDERALAELYLTGSQSMALLVVPLAAVIACFSTDVLLVWTGDPTLSGSGAWVLTLLVVGNAGNGLMNLPFALQLANGWTRLALWVNILSLPLLVPAIWLAATRYGAVGGAAVWAGFSLCLVVAIPEIMHRRLLPGSRNAWYRTGVALPVAVCGGLMTVAALLHDATASRAGLALQLALWWALASLATALCLPRLRARLLVYIGRQ